MVSISNKNLCCSYFNQNSLLLSAPTPVLRELCTRYKEYVTPEDIRIGCATYNVNGGKHFRSVVYKDLSLTDWLLDPHTLAKSRCKYTKVNESKKIYLFF